MFFEVDFLIRCITLLKIQTATVLSYKTPLGRPDRQAA